MNMPPNGEIGEGKFIMARYFDTGTSSSRSVRSRVNLSSQLPLNGAGFARKTCNSVAKRYQKSKQRIVLRSDFTRQGTTRRMIGLE